MRAIRTEGGQSLPAAIATLCVPCVCSWRDDQTGRTLYLGEIRYQGSVPPSAPAARPAGQATHEHVEQAFHDLAREVRKLPELIQSFEIVVGGKRYTDAELAARAVEAERPVCAKVPKPRSAWARLMSSTRTPQA
jgi:hypothetical protein